jgi:hypothetical protein
VDSATAWQMSLDEGQEYWTKVLVDARQMDVNAPIEWGKRKASEVQGHAKISTAPGGFVYQNSARCFRSAQPTQCSSSDVRTFSDHYYATHSTFNLLTNNCAMYACNMLEYCSGDGGKKCADGCVSSLMYSPMEGKTPGCGTNNVKELNTASNVPFSGGFSFGRSPFGVEQAEDDPTLQYQKLFMPMTDPTIANMVAKLMQKVEPAAEPAHTGNLQFQKPASDMTATNMVAKLLHVEPAPAPVQAQADDLQFQKMFMPMSDPAVANVIANLMHNVEPVAASVAAPATVTASK